MSKHVLTLVVVVLVVLVPAGIVGASARVGRGGDPAPASASAAASNPLDPLNASEIATAFTVIERSRRLTRGTFFPLVKLDEPAKPAVNAWTPGADFPRRAFVNVFDRDANQLYEAIVDV